MLDYIETRVKDVANYTIDHKTTIRQTAKAFGVSKSTVHIDLEQRLPQLDYQLYDKVKGILNINLAERHIRGGIATKRLYESLH